MYWKPGVGVGIIAFFVTWLYAIASSGFWLGVCLGWIPALIVGGVAGLLWPIAAVGAFAVGGIALIDYLRYFH